MDLLHLSDPFVIYVLESQRNAEGLLGMPLLCLGGPDITANAEICGSASHGYPWFALIRQATGDQRQVSIVMTLFSYVICDLGYKASVSWITDTPP